VEVGGAAGQRATCAIWEWTCSCMSPSREVCCSQWPPPGPPTPATANEPGPAAWKGNVPAVAAGPYRVPGDRYVAAHLERVSPRCPAAFYTLHTRSGIHTLPGSSTRGWTWNASGTGSVTATSRLQRAT
jgi:hypothetical protein